MLAGDSAEVVGAVSYPVRTVAEARALAPGQRVFVRAIALHERTTLLHNAPHLAQPLPFVMPSYHCWETPFYGIGLKMDDALAGKAGLGAAFGNFLTASSTVLPLYSRCRDLISTVQGEYGQTERPSTPALERYKKCGLLIVDEMNLGNIKADRQDILEEIMRYRHGNALPTLLTGAPPSLLRLGTVAGMRLVTCCRGAGATACPPGVLPLLGCGCPRPRRGAEGSHVGRAHSAGVAGTWMNARRPCRAARCRRSPACHGETPRPPCGRDARSAPARGCAPLPQSRWGFRSGRAAVPGLRLRPNHIAH